MLRLELSRITPAYAGKSHQTHELTLARQDHPRIRGKKSMGKLPKEIPPGSPPHTREKDDLTKKQIQAERITPAYAGKSLRKKKSQALLKDHPRIRGKKIACAISSDSCLGSPPHTREKGTNFITHFGVIRITPAYAGKRTVSTHLPLP